jgi:hypothetical protein
MAVTKDCSGKTVNSPTDKYNAITKLSYCGTSPLAGSLSYGELVQEKYTYTEKITTIDGPTQAAQFKTGCEDKYGQYSIKNGPTGTIVNATVTCKVPNLVKYSGSGSKGMVEDKKDCAALKGEFRLGIFSASYCIMR